MIDARAFDGQVTVTQTPENGSHTQVGDVLDFLASDESNSSLQVSRNGQPIFSVDLTVFGDVLAGVIPGSDPESVLAFGASEVVDGTWFIEFGEGEVETLVLTEAVVGPIRIVNGGGTEPGKTD